MKENVAGRIREVKGGPSHVEPIAAEAFDISVR